MEAAWRVAPGCAVTTGEAERLRYDDDVSHMNVAGLRALSGAASSLKAFLPVRGEGMGWGGVCRELAEGLLTCER